MILQRECRQCPVEDRKRPTHQLPHGVAVEEALLAALLNKCSLDAQVDLGQQAEHGAHVLLLRAQVLDARGLVDLESRGAVRAAHLEERKEEKEGTEKWGQVSEMGGAMGGKGGGALGEGGWESLCGGKVRPLALRSFFSLQTFKLK